MLSPVDDVAKLKIQRIDYINDVGKQSVTVCITFEKGR